MAFFPMFVDLTNKEVLVVGGGHVALRKVCVLKDFGARVVVVAEHICSEIRSIEAESDSMVFLVERGFLPSDCENKALVVAATDNANTNHLIAEQAKELSIPVNAVDQIEDCTFIFPSYVKEENLVAAFSSGGNSPVMTQYLKQKEREVLTPELGVIAEELGASRDLIKKRYRTEKERREAYQKMLEYALVHGHIPNVDSLE